MTRADKPRAWSRIRGYLNLHVDLPTIVVALLIVLLFHRPFLAGVFALTDFIGSKVEFPVWVDDLVVGIAANILSAFIVIPIVFWVFRLNAKSELCGRFKAYDIVKNEEVYWGDVVLTYNIFSNQIRGCLSSKKHDADIHLEAVFERGEYLRGHYVEKKKTTRRRMGAFLLMLDGEGNTYSGPYVFVDPNNSNYQPKEGRVKWVAEKK